MKGRLRDAKAARVAPAAFEDAQQVVDDVSREAVTAQAGKQVAIWMFCLGARDLRETQAAFDRYPAWRSA